jgi:pyruvate dehydrogenase E1 component alpha subunit
MPLNNEQLLDIYYDMVKIRKFEEEVESYKEKGHIQGWIHLSIGQEAANAGVVKALRPSDYKFPDHRGHGESLMCGTDAKLIMAEIFGKATGINRGRGGSMHINDIAVRNMGFNGIQGSTLVTALGTAFASQYKGKDDVSVVFMGDGTLGEGACHESMNLAATWKLPLIYILINNMYAISTRYDLAHPQKQLATWADGYGVPNEIVDGNDVELVYEATQRAADRARRGDGPTLLELMSYRWQGTFDKAEDSKWRPKEEQDAWKDQCPIRRLKDKLLNRSICAEKIAAIEDKVSAEIEDAVKFSVESPDPEPEEALEHVYAGREVER